MCGGANWYDKLFFVIEFLSSFEASLSRIYILGAAPRLAKILCSFNQACLISPACQDFKGSAKIALLSKS